MQAGATHLLGGVSCAACLWARWHGVVGCRCECVAPGWGFKGYSRRRFFLRRMIKRTARTPTTAPGTQGGTPGSSSGSVSG